MPNRISLSVTPRTGVAAGAAGGGNAATATGATARAWALGSVRGARPIFSATMTTIPRTSAATVTAIQAGDAPVEPECRGGSGASSPDGAKVRVPPVRIKGVWCSGHSPSVSKFRLQMGQLHSASALLVMPIPLLLFVSTGLCDIGTS